MALTGPQLDAALDKIASIDISHVNEETMSRIASAFQSFNNLQKNNYEASWSNVLARIAQATDNPDSLAAALAKMQEPYTSDGLINRYTGANDMTVDRGDFRPKSDYMVVALDGAYSHVPCDYDDTRFLDTVLAQLTPETDAVVELGAGWGRNLANIAEHSGRDDVVYIACEQSLSGRDAAGKLMNCAPHLAFETSPFDFYDADLSFLARFKAPLIFTCAAIEQIAMLPAHFVEALLDAAPNGTLVFYEPFGWQRDKGLEKFAVERSIIEIAGILPQDKWLMPNHIFVLRDEKFTENAASWAVSGKYNLNLLNLIRAAVDSGRATQEKLEFDVFAPNPFNPYSLTVLRPTPA